MSKGYFNNEMDRRSYFKLIANNDLKGWEITKHLNQNKLL